MVCDKLQNVMADRLSGVNPVSLGSREVLEFETIPELGMALHLALHIRKPPLIRYQIPTVWVLLPQSS